jgi:hypothetical protein
MKSVTHSGVDAIPSPESNTMPYNNSALETLAAFAIRFAAGLLSSIAFGKYVDKVRRDAIDSVSRPA